MPSPLSSFHPHPQGFSVRQASTLLLSLFGVALASLTPPLQGAIIYTEGPGWSRNVAPPGRGGAGAYVQDIDINNDGTLDFFFRSTSTDYRLIMMEENRVLSTLATPPDLGSYTIGLESGAVIGAQTAPGVWVERVPGSFLIGSIIYSSGGSTIPYDTERFFAVELHLNGELHYGWIAVRTVFLQNSGYVRGWAFQTDRDTDIIAGSIPEPSMTLLLAIGALSFSVRRRSTIIPGTLLDHKPMRSSGSK